MEDEAVSSTIPLSSDLTDESTRIPSSTAMSGESTTDAILPSSNGGPHPNPSVSCEEYPNPNANPQGNAAPAETSPLDRNPRPSSFFSSMFPDFQNPTPLAIFSQKVQNPNFLFPSHLANHNPLFHNPNPLEFFNYNPFKRPAAPIKLPDETPISKPAKLQRTALRNGKTSSRIPEPSTSSVNRYPASKSPFQPTTPANRNADQQNPANSLAALAQPFFTSKRKRSGLRRRAASLLPPSVRADNQGASDSSGSANGGTYFLSSSMVSSRTARAAKIESGDEIIVINKDPTAEALIALTSGFPADTLTEDEIEAGVVSLIGSLEQVNYTIIRNHIISKWRENITSWLYKEVFDAIIPAKFKKLLDSAYDFLLSYGHINFGVASAIKEKIPSEPTRSNVVIVIGAGLAGLAAARQLMASGFKVVVLEGRKRPGGRVYTKNLEGNNKFAASDLGGSVLTGTLGNPLGILAKQLSYPLHKIRDKCPLYKPDGLPVDPVADAKVEGSFNRLLDKASKLRQLMGDISVDVSLGAALETFRQVYGGAVNEEEIGLFNWHLANLEYANAGLLSKLSLAFWDQDDPYDMGGDHCFLPGGNGRLVQALAENVHILYEKTVHTIRYGDDGVQVLAGNQVFDGDMVLCTVPLGVLKSNAIKFTPELPQRKLDSIKRLGFGLLNKVAMLFPTAFWGTDLDTFGHLSEKPNRRGEFFLFYSYATVAGGPLLIALVAGEAAVEFEAMDATDAVTLVLQVLKGIFKPQGIEVPDPIQTVCTRWGNDPFSLGSYSNVAVGASGDDYDILAENVGEGRLFFAGEHTTRRYPATMHGAFLSGAREAANISNYANARTSKVKVGHGLSKNLQSYASLLADLFRHPDLEFGSFSVIFRPQSTEPKSEAILRVTLGGSRKKGNSEGSKPDQQQHSKKLLFQQLQSYFNQQQQLHIYALLSRQQALELREVRGGDEVRLNYLSEKLGVKLVGRRGLGSGADSLIAAIKAERGNKISASSSTA
ncbi:FLOWERING LOCUS D protein [Nymphaea thermarum]|nr:FLOWERING LOCUS D protein [Nymphaea thermarum]